MDSSTGSCPLGASPPSGSRRTQPNPDHPTQAAAVVAMERVRASVRRRAAGGGPALAAPVGVAGRRPRRPPVATSTAGTASARRTCSPRSGTPAPAPKALPHLRRAHRGDRLPRHGTGGRGVPRPPAAVHRRVRARRRGQHADGGHVPALGHRPTRRWWPTSNSLPERLGEGRFHADDFRREIAAIAAHFEVVRIDGPDYRPGSASWSTTQSPMRGRSTTWPTGCGRRASDDGFDALLDHLRRVHPVRFAALIDGLDTVIVRGLASHRQPGRRTPVLPSHRRAVRRRGHVRGVGMQHRRTVSRVVPPRRLPQEVRPGRVALVGHALRAPRKLTVVHKWSLCDHLCTMNRAEPRLRTLAL